MLDTGQIRLSGEALKLFRQGLAAATEKDYDRAVFFYDRVLDLCDDCYEVWYERGLALEASANYREAIASYDRALNICPDNGAASEVWHDRGNTLQYGLGDSLQAIASYDRALQLNANNDQIWHNRGNALLNGLSLAAEALASYECAVKLNPENVRAWRNQGDALLELRRFDQAIASYDRALAMNPDDPVCWYARAMAADRVGARSIQPTTRPAWYGEGFDEPTFVEGDSDSGIIFASQFTATDEIDSLPPGHPLLVLEDDWGRREILLEGDRYQIGRDPHSDICLHSQFVSRHHAVITRITKSNGELGYQITDGNSAGKPSTNGLLINGQKCKRVDLQAEDVIVFGPQVRATYRLLHLKTRR